MTTLCYECKRPVLGGSVLPLHFRCYNSWSRRSDQDRLRLKVEALKEEASRMGCSLGDVTHWPKEYH
jgi:hypothetical protein